MTLALIVDDGAVNDQSLRRQYNDWRFCQISIS